MYSYQAFSNTHHNPHLTLTEVDNRFDSNYFWYKCWLSLMTLVSGVILGSSIKVAVSGVQHDGWKNNIGYLVLVFFTLLAFLQYIIELWAIFQRSLAKATIALGIIIINTPVFLGCAAYFAYSVATYGPTDGDRRAMYALLVCYLVVLSVLALTHIVFTLIPSIKVRRDLINRESVRANLSVSLA